MGIANTLAQYLAERGVKYDVVEHPFAVTASESAKTSHVSLNRLAKAVVLKGDEGFMLAVLPASSHIQFGRLRKQLGADVDMANEEQIETLFVDCERGAVPALGAAYGLKVIVDDSLAMRAGDLSGGRRSCQSGSYQRQYVSAASGRCPACAIH